MNVAGKKEDAAWSERTVQGVLTNVSGELSEKCGGRRSKSDGEMRQTRKEMYGIGALVAGKWKVK
jgi:hypothetical protein